jgi:hypothetical protein
MTIFAVILNDIMMFRPPLVIPEILRPMPEIQGILNRVHYQQTLKGRDAINIEAGKWHPYCRIIV